MNAAIAVIDANQNTIKARARRHGIEKLSRLEAVARDEGRRFVGLHDAKSKGGGKMKQRREEDQLQARKRKQAVKCRARRQSNHAPDDARAQ